MIWLINEPKIGPFGPFSTITEFCIHASWRPGVQHTEIDSLGIKVQYKHKIKLPVDMVSKQVLLYL